jgi:hypothetical protein
MLMLVYRILLAKAYWHTLLVLLEHPALYAGALYSKPEKCGTKPHCMHTLATLANFDPGWDVMGSL